MENNRIKTLREKNNLTLKEVAKGAGIDFTTLSKYENGVVKTGKLETWKKLADYFGVSISYLQNTDAYFDTKDANSSHDDYFKYIDYLKKRGQGLKNDDELTLSSYAQFQLNQLDVAFNMGNTSLRSLPDSKILEITDVFENMYVSFFGVTNEQTSSFYKEYLKMLKAISELTITLNIVDDSNASDSFKEHVGFDRSDVTKILKEINNNLVPKTNIASDFDVEIGKFWDNEKQTYTDEIPKSSHLSPTEKWVISKKIKAQNKKATDD